MIKPKKLPSDVNQRAHEIARLLAEGPKPEEIVTDLSEHMSAIGSKGGQKGGIARKKKLSAKRRKEIAQKAAQARWESKID
jgi:DNA-binding CsgD family transcriptional regulator